jgi:hypothetical protein
MNKKFPVYTSYVGTRVWAVQAEDEDEARAKYYELDPSTEMVRDETNDEQVEWVEVDEVIDG